jgi:hypothetical protein
MKLQYPLPTVFRVLRADEETMTVQMTLPTGVMDLLSEALEIAGRLTGSDKGGAQIATLCQEFLGTWLAIAADQRAAAVAAAQQREARR